MDMLHHSAAQNAAGHRDVTPAHVAAVRGKVRIVDVREPDELRGELGHIEGVESVPLATVEAAARGWDKTAELVLVCRSGGRSGRAAALLAQMGFRRVMNMTGGMLAWNEARLPVVR
jgi:rhodanese-related sulfurtransferase